MTSVYSPLFARAPPKAELDRQLRPRLRIVRRHHRIVARQAPLGPVVIGREAIARVQMPFEHLQLLAVQSDNYGGRWATIMMAGEGVAE